MYESAMLPRLNLSEPQTHEYANFLEALRQTSFSGEIRADYGSRIAQSTDNSIYQVLPQAAVFPRTNEDITALLQLANKPEFATITFSPRGGGTGTNGQSLTTGIIVDASKYMNQILALNLDEGWVRVQSGVVLDQLNRHLAPHGVFFAPTLSPSSRATLGGMINTDACGKGSRVYGKTSDHLLELQCVLSDGTSYTSKPIDDDTLSQQKEKPGILGNIHQQVDDIITEKKELIRHQFPKLRRFLTGYNLAKVRTEDDPRFNLNYLLAGSEGTLCFVTEAKLKLTPLPTHKKLLLLKYNSFDDALHAAEELLKTKPTAIETIDNTILDLAVTDEIFLTIEAFLRKTDGSLPRSVNLVEFTGTDLQKLEAQMAPLLKQTSVEVYCAKDDSEIQALWELRKKGVGLLANTQGVRKPLPFIEDTAVPPENLADYIQELKALLDHHGLNYAMFGHVDVGCLHIRPALNMQDSEDEKLIREISDEVVALVQKYGGVLWAEHGKGFRSEYTPRFFGRELYEDLRKIKEAFDPHNKMNPGKIATPFSSNQKLAPLESPLRGHQDRWIRDELQSEYQTGMSCNGNGACFNEHSTMVMCPSFKATQDRIHSPKGRASMLREWLRQLSLVQKSPLVPHLDTPQQRGFLDKIRRGFSAPNRLWQRWMVGYRREHVEDFSHEVYDAMSGCLACKACVTQCPVHINVPEFKSKFLFHYHTRYFRPLRDYLVGFIELILPLQGRFPRLSNLLTHAFPTRFLMKRFVGLVDLPRLSEHTTRSGFQERSLPTFDLNRFHSMNAIEKENAVILIPDSMTYFYESSLVLETYDFLRMLGYIVYVAPYTPNGKPLHVKGFLPEFAERCQKNYEFLKNLGGTNIPLVAIEPSIALTYREEYQEVLKEEALSFQVQLLQEWLVSKIGQWKPRLQHLQLKNNQEYQLLGHCTEKTAAPHSQKQWQQIFDAFGLNLKLLSSGCCGMAGTYGHEAEHYPESKGIYTLSWAEQIPPSHDPAARQRLLLTGYSCRSQVQRFEHFRPAHPVQALFRELSQY